MAQQRSRNYTVLHKNRARLVEKAKDCLQQLADAAFQRDLISEETKKECCNEATSTDGRAQALVDALLERVGEEDGCFDVLVQILSRIPALAHLGNQLEDESRKEIEGFRVPSTSEGGGQGNLKFLQDGTDLDSGIVASDLVSQSATEAPSVPHNVPTSESQQNGLNGDAATEGGVVETTANFEDSELMECKDDPDMCEDGRHCEHTSPVAAIESDVRHPTSIEEVGRAASNESCVTISSGFHSQVSMASSVSSDTEAVQNLRMEVSQQKCAVTELTQQLENMTRKNVQAQGQLRDREDELQRVTEQKNSEIEDLHSQVEAKEKEVDCYKRRVAEKERENENLKRHHDAAVAKMERQGATTRKTYKENMERLAQSLEDANTCKKKADDELSAIRIRLVQAELEYSKVLRAHEQEISSLKLDVANQNTKIEKMRAELAECNLTKERLQHQEKLRDVKQKHRASLSEVEELKAKLSRLEMNVVQEDHSGD